MNAMDEIQAAVSVRRASAPRPAVGADGKLSPLEIIRELAQRGDLEAFVVMYGLDFETDPDAFDATVVREGSAWLRRGGAL